MSGYRVDSRQLFVNTEVCQQRLSVKVKWRSVKISTNQNSSTCTQCGTWFATSERNHTSKERSNDETFGAEKTTLSKLTVSTRVAKIHSSMERLCTKRPVDKENTHSTLNSKTNLMSFVNTGLDASGQQSTSKDTDDKDSASDHGPGTQYLDRTRPNRGYLYIYICWITNFKKMWQCNNCLVAIGSWSFLVAPTFQMKSCMGRSDLGRGASGMW